MAERSSRAYVMDLLARVFFAALWLFFAVHVWQEFIRTGHITGLLLAVSESLVVVLTIIRRQAQIIDRSPTARIVTFVALIGPPLFRPGSAQPLLPDQATAVVSACGLVLAVSAKLIIGRSFGVIPANRGVVTVGPYGVIRHPIYAGYLIQYLAFVVGHQTVRNVALLIFSAATLVWRALLEERVLVRDNAYRAYCARVSWHLVPGVF